MDEVRRKMRVKHYSVRTEQAYIAWIRRLILANDKRHPCVLGGAEVERFLSGLATEGNEAAGTQNQALSALLFLYRRVLGIELPWMSGVVRAKHGQFPIVAFRLGLARCSRSPVDRWREAASFPASATDVGRGPSWIGRATCDGLLLARMKGT
jgi:hypothetical protein